MKERPDLLTADEYNSICLEMLAFQEANNRLDLSDGLPGTGIATVADKSLTLSESPVTPAVAAAPSATRNSSVLSGIRNLFRAP